MIQALPAFDLLAGATRIIGLSVIAGVFAAAIAVTYRWYAGERIPEGLVVLVSLTVITVYLNTTTALSQIIQDPLGSRGLLELETAIVNVLTFIVGGGAAIVGRRVGDRLGQQAGILYGAKEIDAEVGRFVRAVGRVIPVTLPEAKDIEDIPGYDPVSQSTKDTMGGKTLLFPRGLRVPELRDRLITRLKEDYGVGHVGLDLAEDGSIEYLAVGTRAAGIGATLPPGTAATAIRADPAYAASSGDIVQLWRTAPTPERVASAELRAAVGDIVTLALDETDAETLDPTARYRLMTLPTDPRPELQFASLLRSMDETMGVITIEANSPLAGTPVGALDPTVIGIRPASGAIEAIPPRSYVLGSGDTVFTIARPESLRRLEAGAKGPVEAEPSS